MRCGACAVLWSCMRDRCRLLLVGTSVHAGGLTVPDSGKQGSRRLSETFCCVGVSAFFCCTVNQLCVGARLPCVSTHQ